MKALPACLQLDLHVCEEVFWRRIRAGVPESNSESSSEDNDQVPMAHIYIMKLDIVGGTVNVTKYIGILLKCVVLSASLYSSIRSV